VLHRERRRAEALRKISGARLRSPTAKIIAASILISDALPFAFAMPQAT